jgi:hypothetical protein
VDHVNAGAGPPAPIGLWPEKRVTRSRIRGAQASTRQNPPDPSPSEYALVGTTPIHQKRTSKVTTAQVHAPDLLHSSIQAESTFLNRSPLHWLTMIGTLEITFIRVQFAGASGRGFPALEPKFATSLTGGPLALAIHPRKISKKYRLDGTR